MRISLLAALVAALPATATAQHYKATVLTKGLNHPVGISVHSSGDLYFTELPDPGMATARNKVSMRDATTGKVIQLVSNEPAPTNIVVLANRDFYWTCSTAGVIMRGSGMRHAAIAKGLDHCNGLAVTSAGKVYFTELPTPGMSGKNGGRNTVSVLETNGPKVLSFGEPEPWDVVIDGKGNLYWTCRSAGVILRRDAVTGNKTKVLTGLEKPTGLAIDGSGNLYFTSVPTPGKSGSKGGRNSVWKYDIARRALTLVHFGDPEPTDVTVTSDGSSVYWTCTSAGVIVRADRIANTPAITSMSTTKIGTKVKFDLSAPGQGGMIFQTATAAGVGPIAVDSRYLALAPDGLFFASFLNQYPQLFQGYGGKLDASGNATAALMLPNDAALKGFVLFNAFVTLDMRAPTGVAGISNTFRFVIE